MAIVPRQIRLLIVEDSPDDATLLLHALTAYGFAPTWERVETEPNYLTALESVPDIIFSDYHLPRFSGLRALELRNERAAEIPFIAVSGALGEERAVELIKMGASDFLLKDRMARVGPAVEQALRLKQARDEQGRLTKALAESERQYRALVEFSPDALFVRVKDKIVFVNPAGVRLLGATRSSQLINRPLLDVVHPDDRESVRERVRRIDAERLAIAPIEQNFVRIDGSPVAAEISVAPFVYLGEPATQILARDISERKRAELALARADRALRTLSACNEALVRARDESELLESVCRLVVITGGYRMVWVGYAERDPAKTVRPVANYGHDEGYLASAKYSWADTELGRGPTGTAIRTGTVQVSQDILTNSTVAPWREAALARGYQSCAALPLKDSSGAFGVLTIEASEPDAFSGEEVKLLRELAENLSFGVETLRTRAERDRIAYEHRHHQEILRQSLEDSIKAIAATVEMRDPYTAGHQRRVERLAVAIAGELGLPEETMHGVDLAASIHDLGKLNIPAEILCKPGKLTSIEFMLIKTHAQSGYDILKDIVFPWPIATIVWQHHERLDGSGYPQGLKGDDILLEARVLAVADVVEAMASHRPYRPALGLDRALAEIERGRGTAYDLAVADACLKLFREKSYTLPE